MPSDTTKFQCVVITPQGTLVNCSTSSAVFPAHDGYVGILAHHMPLFCKLGLGIMQISSDGSPAAPGPATTLLIDGGFAMVNSNILTITASNAVSPAHTKPEKIRQDIDALRKSASDSASPADRRIHDRQKAAFLEKLIESV